MLVKTLYIIDEKFCKQHKDSCKQNVNTNGVSLFWQLSIISLAMTNVLTNWIPNIILTTWNGESPRFYLDLFFHAPLITVSIIIMFLILTVGNCLSLTKAGWWIRDTDNVKYRIHQLFSRLGANLPKDAMSFPWSHELKNQLTRLGVIQLSGWALYALPV